MVLEFGTEEAGIDITSGVVTFKGDRIAITDVDEIRQIEDGFGDEYAGVERHTQRGNTRGGRFVDSANWLEIFGDKIVRSKVTGGASNFEGIGDENGGVHIHRSPGNTREGYQVNEQNWVEIFGNDIKHAGVEASHVSRGVIGTVYLVVQYIAPDGSNIGRSKVTVENIETGNILFQQNQYKEYNPDEKKTIIVSETAPDNHNLSNDIIEMKLDIDQSDDNGEWRMSFGNTLKSDHIHRPKEGIIEEFDNQQLFPESCDIKINGNSLGTSIGNGTSFEHKEDITGQLNVGQTNNIEVTSETTGHIQMWVEGDVYRDIEGRG